MIDTLKDTPPIVLSVLLAVFTAIIRVIYDRQETSVIRMFLEATLCGTLAVIAGTAINAMGLDQNWTLFSGGVIGFMGSQFIRSFAQMYVKNKVSGD